MSRKNPAGNILSLFLLLAVLCGSMGLWAYNEYRNEEIPTEKSSPVPDGVPVIEWNEENPEESFAILKSYLSATEPTIAVRNGDSLSWEDICWDNFWVKSFKVTIPQKSDYRIYHFYYLDDADENEQMQKLVEKEADNIIQAIPASAENDDWEKLLFIHDELVRRTEFVNDDENKHSHDIYGALVEHKAVCQGYTYAITYLAGKAGIESKELYSKEHTWNKFPSLSSGEKYTDVTWDDLGKSDENGEPYILHDFFCITKSEMESLDEHKPEDNRDDDEKDTSSGDNYYKKMGYYIAEGDKLGFKACVMEQFKNGKNVIEIRFESKDDYNNAKEWMTEALGELEYYNAYYVLKRDELNIYSAGLYPAAEDIESES